MDSLNKIFTLIHHWCAFPWNSIHLCRNPNALSKSIVCFTCYRNNKSVQCNVKVFCFGRQNPRVVIVDWCVATCEPIALNIIYAKQKSMRFYGIWSDYIRNWKNKINSLVTPNAMVITWLINGITHFHGMHFLGYRSR